MDMQKTYNPKDFEDRIYADWEKSGYFHAEIDENKVPFTIMMPPPNITGQLHMGHAMDATLQDTLIRFKRMQGYAALWLPGCDHASIATEVKIVEKMKELMQKRNEKQPVNKPSAGSTFKRPEGYFAGKLIEDAGLKGYKVGGAEVSTLHAGFIINSGDATSKDILDLIKYVQDKVKNEFGVDLEPEIRIIGE